MQTNACDRQRLDEYLAGRLTADEERTFVRHLDCCDACGSELERQAASVDDWSEVQLLLADTSTVATIPEETKPSTALPLAVRQVLDSLLPTDEPTSLGRLANFEVLGAIGSGAMGVVLKALDRALDRVVALKVMNPSLAMCAAARQRFARESKAAAAVLHPNVIAIHGVATSDELPFLVMPYITGMSLQQRVAAEGALPLHETLRIGSQIAAGLAAAHEQGVIHRDIKPSNIMLDDGVETALITDFGIARTIDDATMTRTGTITGTPEYMSPEQARGDAIDFKSDLFSLGSVLYRICAGRPPFRAQTAYGVLRRITDEQPPTIREHNPDVPKWLCQIIDRLHAKEPNDRPTAAETHALLAGCLAHVYQPDRIPLPDELQESTASGDLLRSRTLWIGAAMLATFIALFVFNQAAAPTLPIGGDSSAVQQAAAQQVAPFSSPTVTSDAAVFKTYRIDFPQPDKKGGVVIDITRGFIEVASHDQPHVEIEVLNPPASKQEEQSGIKQQFAPQFELDTDKAKNSITLDTYNNTYLLNLRVKVPRRTDLALTSYRDGYIQVEGIVGTIYTHSQHGDIRLHDIAGAATGFSYNGDLTASFLSVAKDAQLDFESYNGSIDLTLPADIRATTAIAAGRGTFGSAFNIRPIERSSDPRIADLEDSVTESYQFGAINGGGIGLRIESAKGQITLRKGAE